ncbi:MAG: hypothetical protein NTV80_09825, partial [Verrucomicrobia bacterium]|nr:hypothetical protein [Verrucomicrobiota bacterium]
AQWFCDKFQGLTSRVAKMRMKQLLTAHDLGQTPRQTIRHRLTLRAANAAIQKRLLQKLAFWSRVRNAYIATRRLVRQNEKDAGFASSSKDRALFFTLDCEQDFGHLPLIVGGCSPLLTTIISEWKRQHSIQLRLQDRARDSHRDGPRLRRRSRSLLCP